MRINYEFIEDYNLLIQKAYGEWSTEYYINYIKTTLNNKKMLNVKKIFSDLRNINLEEAFKEIDKLIELRESMINLNYTNVNVVNSPTSTVVSHLYQDKLAQKGFNNHHYCSTIKTAIELLDLDISESEMNTLLKKI